MNLSSFTVLDYLVAAVILISAIYAGWRGFVKETLAIFSWIAAIFAALYFGPYLVAIIAGKIAPHWLASVLAYAGVFLVAFIPFAFISHRLSRAVKSSAIGPLDRVLGLVFGVARGLVIVGLAYLAFNYFVPAREDPPWLRTARSLPLVKQTAQLMLSVVPSQRPRNTVTAGPGHPDRLGELIRAEDQADTADARPAAKKGEKTYGESDRRALDRLLETTGGGGKP